ncbi:MAG: hypothetical protein ACMG55_08455 [Microcoleus sp.]
MSWRLLYSIAPLPNYQPKTFVKFCNNFVGKLSLSAIGQDAEPHDLHFQALSEDESNPCGVSISPAQSCQLNTRYSYYQTNPD